MGACGKPPSQTTSSVTASSELPTRQAWSCAWRTLLPVRTWTKKLVVALTGTVLLVGAAVPVRAAAPDRVAIDRLTYVDRTHRVGSDPRFVELGFDASRSAEVIGADIPNFHSPYLIASSEGPDQLQTVTVDLDRRGELKVVMFGSRSPAYAWPVKGTANPEGKVRRESATWTIRKAKPRSYTFSVLFRARGIDPNVRSFLPETRVVLKSGGDTRTLVLERHVAPLYGSPEIDPGRIYGTTKPVAVRDEWVADPSYIAKGAHHWSTGPVIETASVWLTDLAPGADGALNTGGMGTAFAGDAKVTAVNDFLFEKRALAGFEVGAQTSDLFGPVFPITTNPLNGRIYDGDGGMLNVSISAGSAHWDGRPPRNDDGVLRWDWDGAWAEGWSNVDTFRAPGVRGHGDPIYTIETTLHPGAYGGDIDNRSGRKRVRGPKWFMDLPPTTGISFISWGAAIPPKSEFDLASGFTSDNERFFLRPKIGPGGYLREAETDGYFRRWQPSISIGGNFFGVRPEHLDEDRPRMRRVFAFPEGSIGNIGVAVSTGVIERFEVAPGIWEVTATSDAIDLRLLKAF